MKHLVFPALIGALFMHCQPAAEPVNRSLECYVRYLDPEAELSAEATVREMRAGNPAGVPVEQPGGMRYQNTPMKVLPVEGLSYRLRFPSGFQDRHSFEWADEERGARRFDLAMAPIRDFRFTAEPLKRSSPTAFTWQGEPLQPGETLVFLWEKIPEGSSLRWEIYVTNPKQTVEFPAVKLGELSPGQWALYLVRRRLTRDTIEGMPASGVTEYYSFPDTLSIE